MNARRFSEAVGEVADRYYAEAAGGAACPTAGWPGRWLQRCALAACLCAALALGILVRLSSSEVVTASGFLTVTAYAASSEEGQVLQEGMELPLDYSWSPAMSSRPGLPLELCAPDHPEAAFAVSAEEGTLLLWENAEIQYMETPLYAENGETIYWTSLSQADDGGFTTYTGRTAYIRITIYEGEHIVGYAVVQIYAANQEEDPLPAYRARLLQSVSFPRVNGGYQQITEEYVQAEMDRIQTETAQGAS